MPPVRPAAPPRQSYWELSRSPRYSMAFALPLLLLYEALAVVVNEGTGLGIRNGADVLLRSMAAAVLGERGPLLFGALVALVIAGIAIRDARGKDGPRPRIIAVMLAESAVLALVFGLVVGVVTAQLLDALPTLSIAQPEAMAWPVMLMVSLGAGVYEELVFRVLLVSGLLVGARDRDGVRGGPRGPHLLGVPLHRPLRRPARAAVVHLPERGRVGLQWALCHARIRHHRVDPRALRRLPPRGARLTGGRRPGNFLRCAGIGPRPREPPAPSR